VFLQRDGEWRHYGDGAAGAGGFDFRLTKLLTAEMDADADG
jgi:hypothetical protein